MRLLEHISFTKSKLFISQTKELRYSLGIDKISFSSLRLFSKLVFSMGIPSFVKFYYTIINKKLQEKTVDGIMTALKFIFFVLNKIILYFSGKVPKAALISMQRTHEQGV